MSTKETDRPVHWARGGSNSDRIVSCPGCVNMAAQYPAEPSGAAAVDGTHTHTLLEESLKYNLHDANLLKGKELTDHEGSFVVDGTRADRVNQALGYVMRKHRAFPGVQVMSERFLDAGVRWGIPEWGGSADVVLHDDRELLEIIDYKDGGRPVKPDSYQMVTYAVGAQNLLPHLAKVPVLATIVQPKVYSEPYTHVYSPEAFLNKVETLRVAMVQSMDPDAPRKPGAHCKWCPGAKMGRCPEYNRSGTKAIRDMFAGVPKPATPPTPAEAPTPVQREVPQTVDVTEKREVGPYKQTIPFQLPEIDGAATNEQLAQILDAEPMIMGLLKEAKAEALKRAESGQKIPGHKLVRAKTRRTLVDDAREKLERMRLKKDLYLDTKLKTATQLLSATKHLPETRRKKIEALVIKPEGPLTLAPESDSRKGVETNVSELFKDVPKEVEVTSKPQINFMGD